MASSITGEKPSRPLKPGLNVGDTGAGLHSVIGILGALYQRVTTNVVAADRGFHAGCGHQLRAHCVRRAGVISKAGPRAGNQSIIAGTSPSEVYPCKGGGPNDYCYVYHDPRRQSPVAQPPHGHRPRGPQGRDPRFATPQLRAENFAPIDEILTQWTMQYDKHEVMMITSFPWASKRS